MQKSNEVLEGTTRQGYKVIGESVKGEIYLSVRSPDGVFMGNLCGWYRTNDLNIAMGHVDQAVINQAAIKIQQAGA